MKSCRIAPFNLTSLYSASRLPGVIRLAEFYSRRKIIQDIEMKWLSLLLQAGLSQAALRFGCSTVSIQRLDPLVEPGQIPSAHARLRRPYTCTILTVNQGSPNCWRQCLQCDHDGRHRWEGQVSANITLSMRMLTMKPAARHVLIQKVAIPGLEHVNFGY